MPSNDFAGMLLLGPVVAIDLSLPTAICFFAAALLLDAFDVSLPRGDSVGGAGALCAAALMILGPPVAIVIALASAVVAHALRRGAEAPRRLGTIVSARVVALLTAALALQLTSPWFGQKTLFVIVPAAFLLTELVGSQAVTAAWTGRPLSRLIRGNANSQAPLIAAQWSASVLLLLTYEGMSVWSLVPVVALLLLIRQSYALFLDIRETYRTTVEVLVEAAESQDERRIGHSDRTAVFARSIAVNCGLSAGEVERISYAALLHDLGELAEQPSEAGSSERRPPPSADVVHGVKFFERIEPVLRVCDGIDEGHVADESDLLAGLIVALASDIDSEYHPDVAAAHDRSALTRISPRVTPAVKARAVGAALRLGYRIPAVG